MGINTKIEWATHSFSPWISCSPVHTGCLHCYGAAMAGRLGVVWGPDGTRRRTAASTWKQVEKWNRRAECCCSDQMGQDIHEKRCPQSDRPRVFPSLCDPFEDWKHAVECNQGRTLGQMSEVRRDFFALIDRCPNLDFLLLTKRPENIRRMWPEYLGRFAGLPVKRTFRENVWLLCSASDQASLHAGLEHLQDCADLCPVWGLSLEPLIGAVDLSWMRNSRAGALGLA